jgi:hypothetical protein
VLIPSADIGFFAGYPESYCVRFHRECERRRVSEYDLVKALIVAFLDGQLIEVEKESFSVCAGSSER